jgi:menaquinone-dependent protoporphyrinogen oxidase
MSNRILVAYASRLGSTAGVAESIGKTLTENGASVEVYPMQEVKDISHYTAIVAGSAIQNRQWLPEAVRFVQEHRSTLKQKPFALFAVCMTLAMVNGEKYRPDVSTWLQPVRALVQPVSEGLFAVIAYLVYKDRKTSATLGLVVFSHWVLDFIVHPPDLPLLFRNSLEVGLGLWTSGPGFIASIIMEMILITGGIIIYVVSRRRKIANELEK